MPASRRDAVLAAAVHVLGSVGARGLTHRAVDNAAAVSAGTTSNYFRTREALMRGILAHISAAESAPLDELIPAEFTPETFTAETLVMLAAGRIEHLLGPDRELTLARHALFLEAAWDEQLRPGLLAESQRWWALGATLLAQLGVADPARRSRWLFAYIDGLLADQLARPDPGFDAAAAVRAALGGLLA